MARPSAGPELAMTLAMSLTAAVAALVLAEVALRVAPVSSALALEAAPRRAPDAALAALLTPDPSPDVGVRLRPSLHATFLGVPVDTSIDGFRGPELRDGTRRIVGIGDSVMFGWGVREPETYLRRLEAGLARYEPTVEVVNAAVPGYNTVQEVAAIEGRIERLHPEWVIVGFIGNDFEPPIGVGARQGLVTRNSYLWRLLALRFGGLRPAADPGKRAALVALARLGELARRRRFRVLAFLYAGKVTSATARDARPHAEVRAACRAFGFEILDLQDLLLDAIMAGEIETSFDIWLRKGKPVDPHPSELGHRIIAAGMQRVLEPELRSSR